MPSSPRGHEAVYIGGSDGGVYVECVCNDDDTLSCLVKYHPGEDAWHEWTSRGECERLMAEVYDANYFDPWEGAFVSRDRVRLRGTWHGPR